jgi:hypothetical protein
LTDSNQPPNSNNDKPADAARPEWLPEKFKTPQDLVKSYSELEKKVGTPPAKQEDPQAAEKATAGNEKAAQAEAGAPVDAAAAEIAEKIKALEQKAADSQLDIEALKKEFVENGGKFTEGTLAVLAGKGYKPEQINDFVDVYSKKGEYESALMRMEHAKSLKMTADELDDLVNWTVNLSEEDREQYENLVATKDEKNIRMALKFAKLQRESVEGKAPKYVQGVSAPVDRGYLSAAELRRDMADPRYLSGDPAFHDAVDAKMRRSNRDAWKDR